MTPEEHILFPTWSPEGTGAADASGMPGAPASDAPRDASAGNIPAFLETTGQAPATEHGQDQAAVYRQAPASDRAQAPASDHTQSAAPAHMAEPAHRALDGIDEESDAEARTLFGPEAAAAPVLTPAHATAAAAPSPAPAPAPVSDGPAPSGAQPGGPASASSSAGPEGEHEPAGPETTAEIDVAAVEARLEDPGSTQSFAPISEERINTDSTYDAGTSTSLMWGARSDVGCVRTHNEDSYLVQSPLFCVCDGMGGHAAGEVASSIAVETIARLAPQEADATRLAAAVEAANAAIIEAAANGLGKPGMGCTATAAYIEGNVIAIAHVGDSRAYLLHEGTLIRITHDHSYVEELVDAGEITADEARVHPNRSVITRALGSDPAMYADHFQLNIEEGDRLILCSDGLSSMISDGEIENIATQSPTAQICTDNLVDAALNAGGGDNVTVVVVDVVDDGRMRDLGRRRKRNLLIAGIGLLAAIIIAFAATAIVISNSVFLGIKDGCVAIYTGIPNSFMGIDLFHLSDETSIDIDDLPEDTQNRLRAGISQHSMDEARETVSEYRQQIYEEQTRQAQDAAVIHGESADGGSDAGDAEAAAPADDAAAPEDPAANPDPAAAEGGEG